MVIRGQANGVIEVIYIDSMGGSLEREKNVEVFMKTITELAGENAHIVELRVQNFIQQRNFIDCGPFTVDNLVTLAQAGNQLDNLDAEQIINLEILNRPIDGGAAELRALHNVVLNSSYGAIVPVNAVAEDSAEVLTRGNPSLSSSLSAPKHIIKTTKAPTSGPTMAPDSIKLELDNPMSSNSTNDDAILIRITLEDEATIDALFLGITSTDLQSD